jgi:hypothetical protein
MRIVNGTSGERKPVTVEFTPEEADFMADLMGSMVASAYGHTYELFDLLDDAGFGTEQEVQGTFEFHD